MARLPEDAELLERARAHADALVDGDPDLSAPENALLRDAVLARYGSDLDPIPRSRARREGRGRPLRRPAAARARGRGTRPTADRVREALFSILGDVSGLRVLDLFAGSGALGIEALSRGAAEAVFVDSAPRAVAAVRANLEALGLEAKVHRRDALDVSRRAAGEVRVRPPVLRPAV